MEYKYNIKVISNSCGIKPHTLRVWEQRYGVFNPGRSDGGQRLYCEEDLIKAKILSTLTRNGHSISKLAKHSVTELEDLLKQYNDNFTQEHPHSKTIKSQTLLKYLEEYKINEVVSELQHLRSTMGVKNFLFDIILPTMKAVGDLQAKGKYTVSQEHIISVIVRDQLSQVQLPQVNNLVNHIALATPEGNLHELSLIMANLLCRGNRIPTHYLGPAHPADCLGEAVNALNASILVLGVVSSDYWVYEENIVNYLKQIDNHLRGPIQVILGGGYALDFPHFENITDVTIMSTLEDFDEFLMKLS